MLIDARDLADQSPIRADVCIVGSGPAGLAVAAELARSGITTVVLEQGDKAEIGGNATRWLIELGHHCRNGVRLAPLPPETFAPRPAVGGDGWPIGEAELAPYYGRAQQLFGLSPFGFAADEWEEAGARRLPLPEDRVVTAVYQFADGHVVHDRLRRAVAEAAGCRLVYHATAREIVTAEGGTRARAVLAVTPAGEALEVRADTIVVAAGGLESAHLLLLSDRDRSAAIGNEHDRLGRCLMDHPLLDGGDFVPHSPRLIDAMALYDLRLVHDLPVMGHLRLAPGTVRERDLLQLGAMFFPRELDHRRRYRLSPRQEQALRATFEFRSHLRSAGLRNLARLPRMALGADALVGAALRDARGRFPRLGRGGWSARRQPSRVFGAFQVVHQVEQPPRPDNRVTLGRETDDRGRRVLEKHWRWHPDDVARTLAAQDLYAAEIAAAGLGEYRIARPDGQPLVLTLSTAHLMGTTRMHADRRRGVVDPACRVHAVDNVFVASSGTFTTGSFINPTLTIVALALRIADTIGRSAAVRPSTTTGPAHRADAPTGLALT